MSTETALRTSNGMISISDILFLREPLPTRPLYDVTAKFAEQMMTIIKNALAADADGDHPLPHYEHVRLEKHYRRYQDICDRHISYEPDTFAGTKYAGGKGYTYK